MVKIKAIKADNPKVITIVITLLKSSFQLTASRNPINPNKHVIMDKTSTIYKGCIFNKLFDICITALVEPAKNSIMQSNANKKDQKLILIFINPPTFKP